MKTTTQNIFKPIVSIRIPRKLLQKIDAKAKEKNTTRSFIINQMLKEYTTR